MGVDFGNGEGAGVDGVGLICCISKTSFSSRVVAKEMDMYLVASIDAGQRGDGRADIADSQRLGETHSGRVA